MATYKVKYGDTLSGIARANGTSVQALMAANPTITNANVIRAGASLNLGGTKTGPTTPTPQPTTTPTTPAPTIAEKASMIPDIAKTDPAVEAYYKEQADAMSKPIDEKAMRDEIRQRYNDQFESLRIAAAQKIAGERKLGEGRLGSARALQARSGTLGSNFAGAENDQVNRDTEDIVNSINAETDAKIAFLMGQSEQDYSSQIAAAREAKKAGADEYIKFLQTRDSQRTEQVSKLAKLFASQGIDPKTLSAADVTKLEKTYGVNLDQLSGLITEEKNKINKDAFFELSDGQARYEYDPATGTAKLVAENAKNFAPKSSSGSGSSYSSIGSSTGSSARTDLDALIANVATGISAKNQRDTFYSNIKNARNDQDKIATIASALKITGPAREDLTQTQIGQNNLRQAIKILENGTKTGVVKSGTNYAFNLVGGQVDPKLTELKQYITAAIQPYRSSVTGAAWGSQEEAEYKSMFGSISDNPETLITKLKNLDKIMTSKRVGIISSYADPLGSYSSSFDSYYPQQNTVIPANTQPTVTVYSVKNGAAYQVPKDQLQKTLSSGMFRK